MSQITNVIKNIIKLAYWQSFTRKQVILTFNSTNNIATYHWTNLQSSLRLSHRSALRIKSKETNMKWSQTDNPSSPNSSTVFKKLCQIYCLRYYNILRTSASYFIFFSSKICACSSFWCSNSDFRKVWS